MTMDRPHRHDGASIIFGRGPLTVPGTVVVSNRDHRASCLHAHLARLGINRFSNTRVSHGHDSSRWAEL